MRLLSLVCLAACSGGSHPVAPDAPVVTGNFSCVGTPWPTTAPDPLAIEGTIEDDMTGGRLPGQSVEIHAADGTLLAQMTTTDGPLAQQKGNYYVDVATGGVAPTIYRKASGSGYVDTYTFDAFAVFKSYPVTTGLPTQSELDAVYQMAGLTSDPSKGTLLVDLYDCNPPPTAQHIGAGATIEAPLGARVVYQNPSFQPDPSLDATTVAGSAVILGVTPGTVDVVVHAGDVTYRSWPVQVFAGARTISIRHP